MSVYTREGVIITAAYVCVLCVCVCLTRVSAIGIAVNQFELSTRIFHSILVCSHTQRKLTTLFSLAASRYPVAILSKREERERRQCIMCVTTKTKPNLDSYQAIALTLDIHTACLICLPYAKFHDNRIS